MAAPHENPAVLAFREWQNQSRLIESVQIGFLLGPPKTGTSWITSILQAHPNAVSRGEGHFPTRLIPALKNALETYGNAQAGTKRSSANPPPPWTLPDSSDLTMLARQACDRMFMRYLVSGKPDSKDRILAVIDKTPDNARHIELLDSLYPWAKFVCITRDVRDTAVSSWFHRQLLGDTGPFKSIEDFAPAFAHDVWGPMMWLARRAARSLGPQRYTEIRYEDCKTDPVQTVGALLRFFGLPDTPELVRACIDTTSFKSQSGREPGNEDASFYRKGIVGDWQNHLSQKAADQTIKIAADILAHPFTPQAPNENALTPAFANAPPPACTPPTGAQEQRTASTSH